MKPPRSALDALSDNGISVIGIGKISDIFAGQGVTESHPTTSNAEGMERIAELWRKAENSFLFANLVDFDMLLRTPARRRRLCACAQRVRRLARGLSAAHPSGRSGDHHRRSRE
jgi:phosphopentomutase